ARSGAAEGRAAEDDADDGEGCEDQPLVLPGELRIAPGDGRDGERCGGERCGGEPNADHRRYGDIDDAENGAEHGPIPERHQRGSVGRATAGLGAVRAALKLSRANSAMPASDPIIDALSSGIRITFWLGVPARRPIASI